MCKYIVKDMLSVCNYLPIGIILVLGCSGILGILNKRRVANRHCSFSVLSMSLLISYIAMILLITFLSREDNGNTGLYLELFSSWGINARNNAYFIENILLFIPLGIFSSLVIKRMRNCILSLLAGLGFSFCIESLQYVTGRGVFQVDDILTNGLGMLLGCVVFGIVHGIGRRRS